MASDLYGLLAEAYSRPSRASQDLEATLGAVKSVDEGLRAYKARQNEERLKKIQLQSLSEVLGDKMPPGGEWAKDIPLETLSTVTPTLKVLADYSPKETKTTDLPRWQQANFQYNGNLVLFNPDPRDPHYIAVTPQGPKRIGPESQGSSAPLPMDAPAKADSPVSSIPIGGSITPRVAPTAPATDTAKIGDLGYLKDLIKTASKNYSDKFTGASDAMMTRAGQFTGEGASEKAAYFMRSINDMSDALLRARSGAQINEQEYSRLRKLVPSQYTSDQDFIARLKAFDEAVSSVIENKRSSMQQMGYRVPGEISSSKSGIPKFSTERDAEKSGAKGLVIIGNEMAVIE